jgi:hypothetical protein
MRFITFILLVFSFVVLSNPLNSDITASRQNAITRAVSRCSPAVVGINVIENRVGVVRGNS